MLHLTGRKQKFLLFIWGILCLFVVTACTNSVMKFFPVPSEGLETEAFSPTPRVAANASGQDVAVPPVLLVTGEYLPYTSESLPNGGLFTQFVLDIFDEMGVAAEVRFYPWQRCEAMVEAGEAWASFPYGDSAMNAERFAMSEPLTEAIHRYFYMKDNDDFLAAGAAFDQLKQFKSFVFGGVNGYWYGSSDALIDEGLQVEWATDTLGLIHMLESQRIDFFIEDEKVAWHLIEQAYPHEADRFGMLPQEAARREYLLIVSRKYPETEALLDDFHAAAQRMRSRAIQEGE